MLHKDIEEGNIVVVNMEQQSAPLTVTGEKPTHESETLSTQESLFSQDDNERNELHSSSEEDLCSQLEGTSSPNLCRSPAAGKLGNVEGNGVGANMTVRERRKTRVSQRTKARDTGSDTGQRVPKNQERPPSARTSLKEPIRRATTQEHRRERVEERSKDGRSRAISREPQSRGASREPRSRGVSRDPQPRGVSREPRSRGVSRDPQSRGVNRDPQSRGVSREPRSRGVSREPQPRGVSRGPRSRGVSREPQPRGVSREPRSRGTSQDVRRRASSRVRPSEAGVSGEGSRRSSRRTFDSEEQSTESYIKEARCRAKNNSITKSDPSVPQNPGDIVALEQKKSEGIHSALKLLTSRGNKTSQSGTQEPRRRSRSVCRPNASPVQGGRGTSSAQEGSHRPSRSRSVVRVADGTVSPSEILQALITNEEPRRRARSRDSSRRASRTLDGAEPGTPRRLERSRDRRVSKRQLDLYTSGDLSVGDDNQSRCSESGPSLRKELSRRSFASSQSDGPGTPHKSTRILIPVEFVSSSSRPDRGANRSYDDDNSRRSHDSRDRLPTGRPMRKPANRSAHSHTTSSTISLTNDSEIVVDDKSFFEDGDSPEANASLRKHARDPNSASPREAQSGAPSLAQAELGDSLSNFDTDDWECKPTKIAIDEDRTSGVITQVQPSPTAKSPHRIRAGDDGPDSGGTSSPASNEGAAQGSKQRQRRGSRRRRANTDGSGTSPDTAADAGQATPTKRWTEKPTKKLSMEELLARASRKCGDDDQSGDVSPFTASPQRAAAVPRKPRNRRASSNGWA